MLILLVKLQQRRILRIADKTCFAIFLSIILFFASIIVADAEKFSERFGKGTYAFGVEFGGGYTFNLPPGPDRTDMDFLFFFPNFKYNLTGVMGKSFYRGSLYWVLEVGAVVTYNDSVIFRGKTIKTGDPGLFQIGVSPVLLEYKFLSPTRRWAPYILLGGGFSYGDFVDAAIELGTKFEFLLHAGVGIEYFLKKGSISLKYRLFHLSNSNIKPPNTGLNSHVLALGFSF